MLGAQLIELISNYSDKIFRLSSQPGMSAAAGSDICPQSKIRAILDVSMAIIARRQIQIGGRTGGRRQ